MRHELRSFRYYLALTVPILCLLCFGRAEAQWVWDVTDSTTIGTNENLYSLSCAGNICTSCGLSLDIPLEGYRIIFKHSTDGGITWSTEDPKLPVQRSDANNNLNAVCQIDSLHAVAVGDTALILKTSDGGTTWTQQECPTRSELLAVDFSDTLTGIAVGTRPPVVLTTSDGGLHWNEANIHFGNFFSCHSFGEGKFSAFAYGNGPVYITRNWWTTIDSGALIPDFVGDSQDIPVCTQCRFYGADTILAVGALLHLKDSVIIGRWSYIIRSTNAGQTWQAPIIDSNYPVLDCISPIYHDTLIAGSVIGYGRMLLSTDAGNSWKIDSLLFNASEPPACLNAVEFTSDGIPIGMLGQAEFQNSFLARGLSEPAHVEAYERIIAQTHIFPNPASSVVNIASIDNGRTFHILDILGREVMRGIIPLKGPLTLNVSALPSGIYIVMLDHDGKTLPVGKMVLTGE